MAIRDRLSWFAVLGIPSTAVGWTSHGFAVARSLRSCNHPIVDACRPTPVGSRGKDLSSAQAHGGGS
jgi:hypothetical protein